MCFLLKGGVFLSHYPSYSPENAVLNCFSPVADLKEKIRTDFFQCTFFSTLPFHLHAYQLATCKAKAL